MSSSNSSLSNSNISTITQKEFEKCFKSTRNVKYHDLPSCDDQIRCDIGLWNGKQNVFVKQFVQKCDGAQFKNEVQVRRSLNYPNHPSLSRLLAIVYDNDENKNEDDDCIYALIFECCVDYQTLDQLDLKHWTFTDIIHCFIQLLQVLEFLHSLHVIHHDISTTNILVHPKTKHLVLVDLGVSEILLESNHYKGVSKYLFAGVRHSDAPERKKDSIYPMTCKFDIYCASIIFLSMVRSSGNYWDTCPLVTTVLLSTSRHADCTQRPTANVWHKRFSDVLQIKQKLFPSDDGWQQLNDLFIKEIS